MNQSIYSNERDILIVDDTPDNLRFLAALLTEQGYNVRKALDGQMALMACQTLLPDLILLDIMMPDLDGYTVCQQLKANEYSCRVPVIFLSAIDDALDKVKAFKAGGSDYITKPFQAEEVIIRVQNQLKIRDAEIKILNLNSDLEKRVQERTLQLENTNQKLLHELQVRKELQNKLLHMAWHDPLTDLPNRTLFMERLEKSIKQSQGDANFQFAVLFLDCDRFKIINDSLGHLIGDELLIAIGKRIKTLLKNSDTLARLGGDEFAILLDNIETIEYPSIIAQQILQELTNPFQLSRTEVFITSSIGIVFSTICYNLPQEVLRDADNAMYRAKAKGRSNYCIFTPDMHQQAIKVLQLENDLKRAIERGELIVYYQPIVSLSTGKISAFEALVRWQHPTLGMISPADFIPIAEETGLIVAIDIWVLQTACLQLRNWQQQHPIDEKISISINLSVRLFSQANLVEKIVDILQTTRLKPQNLKLEITESAIMENSDKAATILQQLREREIQLSIDDFGTGYSSLSYLQKFPVNALKIDRAFVSNLESNSRNFDLVSLVIDLSNKFGMNAIAEGIETRSQLAKLRNLGCGFGQGYLFSKPLNADLALALVMSAPQW